MIRLFVPDELKSDGPVRLERDEFHYLVQVMRRAAGDEVELFNGRDGAWIATLDQVSKREAILKPQRQVCAQPTASPLVLVQALVKRSPLETIIEKATELGAGKVMLITTRRTNADRTNLARLSAIAREAAEQTGRCDLPQIEPPVSLDQWLGRTDPDRPLIYCDEAGGTPIKDALASLTPTAAGLPTVLIGPEGGFAPAERAALRGRSGTLAVSLGPRILRADTAAIAALTLVQAMIGDWRDVEPAD